ncbi:acyl-CoA N-acyltransferase [Jimgerdemannia flammicorona]|uniref:Acyl-CoA N-acyltransferase n=1 Tax=Jimgerdemannia flammicorona TaxID=994334 RepID=A0A433QI42_9FUNG|nr:acyl-CoA N-acyltransferase [Jimgerdemannia flammicorona]
MDTQPTSQYLGDGLVMRWSTPADAPNISRCAGRVYNNSNSPTLNEVAMARTARLLRGDSPFMSPNDFAIIIDASQEDQPVVAFAGLWKHTIRYDGIACPVGRLEYVGTLEAYRNHGLSRKLIEFVHAWSAARGDLVQILTGIPWFYRQFGYEYGYDRGDIVSTLINAIPKLKDGDLETCFLREANLADVPTLIDLFNTDRNNSSLWLDMPSGFLEYLIVGHQHSRADLRLDHTHRVYVVMDLPLWRNAEGRIVGFVVASNQRQGGVLEITHVGFSEDLYIPDVIPSLLRAIHAAATSTAVQGNPGLTAIQWIIPASSRFRAALPPSLTVPSTTEHCNHTYFRVPDLVRFLCSVVPALDARLARSRVYKSYTGKLAISFYDRHVPGVFIAVDRGRVVAVEELARGLEGNARFPPLTFLQVLFGRRSVGELKHVFPDIEVASPEVEGLIGELFPSGRSEMATFFT